MYLWHHDTGLNGLFDPLHGLFHVPLGLLGSGALRWFSVTHAGIGLLALLARAMAGNIAVEPLGISAAGVYTRHA